MDWLLQARMRTALLALLLTVACASATAKPVCRQELSEEAAGAARDEFDRRISACKKSGGATTPLHAPDLSRSCWYSVGLAAMGEQALWAGDRESYRFLWLRAFDEPVMIRIDSAPDGTGVLTAKMQWVFEKAEGSVRVVRDLSRPSASEYKEYQN